MKPTWRYLRQHGWPTDPISNQRTCSDFKQCYNGMLTHLLQHADTKSPGVPQGPQSSLPPGQSKQQSRNPFCTQGTASGWSIWTPTLCIYTLLPKKVVLGLEICRLWSPGLELIAPQMSLWGLHSYICF